MLNGGWNISAKHTKSNKTKIGNQGSDKRNGVVRNGESVANIPVGVEGCFSEPTSIKDDSVKDGPSAPALQLQDDFVNLVVSPESWQGVPPANITTVRLSKYDTVSF